MYYLIYLHILFIHMLYICFLCITIFCIFITYIYLHILQSAVAAYAATIRVDTTLYVECLTGGVSIIVSEETQETLSAFRHSVSPLQAHQ